MSPRDHSFVHQNEPISNESHVSVSVVVVILVKCVEADSVEVLMVELHDVFMTIAFGPEALFVLGVLLINLLVLAVL